MNRQHVLNLMAGVVVLICMGIALPVQAQTETVTPFDLVGHIQKFTLDDPNDQFSAAKLIVNGIQIIIPRNLVIQFPAAYFTAQQVFDNAQGMSKKNKESGLALEDQKPPLAAFEVAIAGNIVGGEYRAGLVSISQQSLNNSAGFIHGITPATGMMCVGASLIATTCETGDARIRLNDPKITDTADVAFNDGRYGMKNPDGCRVLPLPSDPCADDPNSRFPDPRFMVDQGNPTVHALTGYPMCVPRSSTDNKCPTGNRPLTDPDKLFDPDTNPFLVKFVMDSTALVPPSNFGSDPITPCGPKKDGECNPGKQAPFKIGDYVTYAGTLAEDTDGRYISVHTMVANVGIYTGPGGPAYVTLDESLLGTKGKLVLCGSTAECQDRIKVEGFTTDPNRTVNIYAVDVDRNGSTWKQTARRLTNTPNPNGVGLVNTAKDQAVWGRFRYVTGKNAGVLFDRNSVLKGATRELMARINDNNPFPDESAIPESPKVANGLTAGIYVAPIGEYIFPEPTGVQGGPLPALNFQCLAFLVNGWALPDNGLPNIPRLEPWPGATPTFSCSN